MACVYSCSPGEEAEKVGEICSKHCLCGRDRRQFGNSVLEEGHFSHMGGEHVNSGTELRLLLRQVFQRSRLPAEPSDQRCFEVSSRKHQPCTLIHLQLQRKKTAAQSDPLSPMLILSQEGGQSSSDIITVFYSYTGGLIGARGNK